MLYALLHDGLLETGAEIQRTSESPDELAKRLNASPAVPEGEQIIGWVPCDFSDCWVKLCRPPEVDDEGVAFIDGIACRVDPPGTHPGGRMYWLTPIELVYVPVWETRQQDDAEAEE